MPPDFRTRVSKAIRAFRSNVDLQEVSRNLDLMIQRNELDTGNFDEEKQLDHSNSPSRLDIRHTDYNLMAVQTWGFLRALSRKGDKIPPYGDPTRDWFLDTFWRNEPILAGAVYSMTAKMAALRWMITGKRLMAREAAMIFATAAHIDGWDWGGFVSSSAQDFYCTDNGVFWETARQSEGSTEFTRLAGRLAEIGHIDSMSCSLTGNKQQPVYYASELHGQNFYFKPGEVVHFASLINARERNLGIGFCAVDRAYRAAKLLMGLHDYDEEKLNNLPPEGVAAVTGLTVDEFMDAIAMWKEKRIQDQSLTFPQVLWLIGNQPNTEVKVDFTGFSQVPESFDRKAVVDQYVATLALVFGVDVREFWPITGGSLGTASESEIQHLKAKGKGPGEFISLVERHINAELQEGCDFRFDTQDIEEDANQAAVAKAWVDALLPLYNLKPAAGAGGLGLASGTTTTPGTPPPPPQSRLKANPKPDKPNGAPNLPTPPLSKPNTGRDMTNSGSPFTPFPPAQAEQIITKDQILRLLADKGVLPDYFVDDQRTVVYDTEVHLKMDINWDGDPNEITRFEWTKDGVLREKMLPPIILNSTPEPEDDGDPVAIQAALDMLHQKEAAIMEDHRNIRGKPIPSSEALRGPSITKNTIHAELERWRSHPILSKYALTPEEEEQLLSMVAKQ